MTKKEIEAKKEEIRYHLSTFTEFNNLPDFEDYNPIEMKRELRNLSRMKPDD